MKRINPQTGEFFKKGDVREDGYRFWSYDIYSVKNKTGFYREHWRNPTSYFKERQNSNVSRLKHQKEKPHLATASATRRHTAKLKRTPIWLTKAQHLEIEGFYLLAKEMEKQFGQKYEVDHIVPLRGKTVSGLHVPWNLQVLTKKENCSKNNSF